MLNNCLDKLPHQLKDLSHKYRFNHHKYQCLHKLLQWFISLLQHLLGKRQKQHNLLVLQLPHLELLLLREERKRRKRNSLPLWKLKLRVVQDQKGVRNNRNLKIKMMESEIIIYKQSFNIF